MVAIIVSSKVLNFCHESSKKFIQSKTAADQSEFVHLLAKKTGSDQDVDNTDNAKSQTFEFVELDPTNEKSSRLSNLTLTLSRLSNDIVSEEQILYNMQQRRKALSSIVVLSSMTCPRVQTLIKEVHNGHLIDIGLHLLNGLRLAAPTQQKLAARVGDFNENLFYEMRPAKQNLESIIHESQRNDVHEDTSILLRQDISSFETSIRQSLGHANISYRGSYMTTEQTMFQPAHVDYDYDILNTYGQRLYLAFFPLTEEGMFLQLWQDPKIIDKRVEGTVVFIPHGKMLIVSSDTIHGGGFQRGVGGNLRFHLYIEVEGCGSGEGEKNSIKLLDHPMNKYTERHDKRRELCERFVDLNGLEYLLGNFFDDKKDDVPMKYDVSVKGANIPSIKSVKVVDSVAGSYDVMNKSASSVNLFGLAEADEVF